MVGRGDGDLRDRFALGQRQRPGDGEPRGRQDFLARPGSWRIVVDLIGIAMAGGLFTVPLYAILQHESEPSHRSRVIAANNIINALFMTAATGAAALLSQRLTMGELFALVGFTTFPVAASPPGSCGVRSSRA